MKSRTVPQRAVRADAQHATAPEAEMPSADEQEFGPRPQQRFGAVRKKLEVEKIPGFEQRWINDIPGRVDYAKECGYAHVTDANGNPIFRVVDKGGLRAYRMKIPAVWYNENKAEELEEQVDSVERDIMRGKAGSLNPGQDGAYVPTDGRGGPSRINIRHGSNPFKS